MNLNQPRDQITVKEYFPPGITRGQAKAANQQQVQGWAAGIADHPELIRSGEAELREVCHLRGTRLFLVLAFLYKRDGRGR